ncbi:hypothetical protein [Variovorax atrisoli]|uniref:hypothetical protein n=1 Tax=Variovorax atrisoli TaxID=3394203 RepID=UPI003395C0DA
MLCDVYILYESGQPLPEEVVRARPARGWLCYGDAGRNYPHEEAHLFLSRGDAAEVIPFVDYARVKKIKRGGLRIEGLQEHGYRDHWKQVWWCLPVTDVQTVAPSEQATQAYAAIRAVVMQVDATGPACALDDPQRQQPA